MLFSITISSMVSASTTCIYALDMLLNIISVVLFPSKISSLVIFNNPSISSSALIPVTSYLVLFVLFVQ